MKQLPIRWGGLALGLLAMLLLPACINNPADDLPDLYETLQADERFGIFTEAIEKAGLEEEINTFYFTLFVPPDAIFESYLQSKGYGSLDSIPEARLGQLIRYHIQQNKTSDDLLAPNYYLTPAFNAPDSNFVVILVESTSTGIRLNGQSTLIQTNIEARNGYIHVIDQVLEPPSLLDVLEANNNLSIFREAIQRIGFNDLVRSGSPYTLFVPANGVFESYFEQVEGVADLDDLTDEQLRPIIRYHVSQGNLRRQVFADAIIYDTYATLSTGDSLRIGGDLSILINDSVSFFLNDVQATNGVIHFISDVLDPK